MCGLIETAQRHIKVAFVVITQKLVIFTGNLIGATIQPNGFQLKSHAFIVGPSGAVK